MLAAPYVAPRPPIEPMFNVRSRRVGGLRFVWVGRFVFSFCIRGQA